VVVCPTVTITHNGNVLYVPSGFASYAWSYEGAPVGGNDAFLFTQGDGLYTVSATDVNGCTVTDEFTLITTGVLSAGRTGAVRMEVFPVPNNGTFTVVGEGLTGSTAEVRVLDVAGRVVYAGGARVTNGTMRTALLLDLPSGAYAVQMADADRVGTVRMVVR
jgi:hypothetical protein